MPNTGVPSATVQNEMAISLSNGPVDELVRIHTEHTDWDEPDVRYLLRPEQQTGRRPPALRVHQPDGNKELVLSFGSVRVHIHATEDHIRVVLREAPTSPRAA